MDSNLSDTNKSDHNSDPNVQLDSSKFELPKMNNNYFIENKGQWKEHILFLAQSSFGYIALCNDGVFYYVVQEKQGHAVKLSFQNAYITAIIGQNDVGFNSNYFYGSDSANWISQARSYKEVIYKDVWPGIDILYYFKDNNLKYDIIVGEYSDPAVISFKLEGQKYFEIGENDLDIALSDGISISDSDLIAFYEDGISVPISFKKTGLSTYGFDVKKTLGKTLIIDPFVFSSSTYFGGSGGETPQDIVVDKNDNIIVLGGTNSYDFPNTTGAYQNSFMGGFDLTVSKLDKTASSLIFSTYIGDWSSDIPGGLDVDGSGDIYVTGGTYSYDFPTTNGSFQDTDPSPGFPDVFALKLSSAGDQLLYSTYIGGTGSDQGHDLVVHNQLAYITGNTLSYDFPTVGQPVMDAHGSVLLLIVNQDGSNLTHSTFWGGFSNEFGYGIAVDQNEDVVIGGTSSSQDFPTTSGAFQEAVNDTNNGIVIKYRPSTNTTLFSTFIGGEAVDTVTSLSVDSSNNIYFSGITTPTEPEEIPFPVTQGAFNTNLNGNRDAYIAKMNPDGTNLIYCTFIGGDGDEESKMLVVDDDGIVYLTGSIDSQLNFTTTADSFDSSYNEEGDAYLVVLNPLGSDIIYATFLGGNDTDSGFACALSNSNNIIVLGQTASLDFPVSNGSYQMTNKGYGDYFITTFSTGNLTFLHEGWNLISIPFIQPDTNLNAVLSSISGFYDAVQWYDANDKSNLWKHNQILKSSPLNDLTDLDHVKGIWIHITKPGGVFFEYSGTPALTPQSISLRTGWNLVGYPSETEHVGKIGLNNLKFGIHVDVIQWYDAETRSWQFLDAQGTFIPGRGYWVHSLVDATWDVPL
jgi:hypothetical protein